MRKNKYKDYAIYRGDEFIDLGSVIYLSKKYNLKKTIIYNYSCSKYMKKKINGKNGGLIVICLDDEEEEDD